MTLLRLGLGIVFLAFGIGKFKGDEWVDTMRSMGIFSYLPWSVDTSVILAGILELLVGLGLVLGLFTRFFSLLASLEMVSILILLFIYGIHEIRDIGLLAGTVCLIFNDADFISLDHFLKKRFPRPYSSEPH